MNTTQFFEQMEASIAKYDLLCHPFYKAWTAGELTRDDLREYIERGYHGDMGWLADTSARRGDPQTLWPEARTVVVLGLNYGGDDDPLAALSDPERA